MDALLDEIEDEHDDTFARIHNLELRRLVLGSRKRFQRRRARAPIMAAATQLFFFIVLMAASQPRRMRDSARRGMQCGVGTWDSAG
jgi:hypothetical protein